MPATNKSTNRCSKAPKLNPNSNSFPKKSAKNFKGPSKSSNNTGPQSNDNSKKRKRNKSTSNESKNGSKDSAQFVAMKKSKKARIKSMKKQNSDESVDNRKNENVFQKHLEDVESDDEVLNISEASVTSEDDYQARTQSKLKNAEKDVIMIDSDTTDESSTDDDEVIHLEYLSDTEDEFKGKNQKDIQKNNTMNQDFISLDISSETEDDENTSDYESNDIDNEYLSNDEGSYLSKNIKHKAGAVIDEFPWIRNSDHSKEKEIADWLTSEIKDFVKYISPSVEEINSRNKVIENLRTHIKSIWPDAELHCFGSFATDLYLPGSDIDCVVVSKRGRYDNKSSLYQLTSYIRNHKLGVEVTPIAKAKVPIIKFVDPTTRIHIDISFERSNGLTAAKLIIDWLRKTPGLRELVLIVKQFLAVRKLNEVHVGGLGGFSIICLCYSFLKLHPRISTNNIDPLENLGCLLIEFFELYGYNFGYDEVGIAFTSDYQPIYISKRSHPDLMGRNPFSLAIQDPHDPSNNISRGSFNLRDIKRAFGGAFELLVNRCYQLNSAKYKDRLGQSILGGIIKYKGKQRDFIDARHHVKNVAFHAASTTTKSVKVKSGILPPLPSEKAGIDPNDFYLSDSYYTTDGEDDHNDLKIYEDSQKSKNGIIKNASKSGDTARSETEKLLNMRSDDDEKDDLSVSKSVISNEPDFSDSDDDDNYDPSKLSAVAAVAKEDRRDYWSQKSGKTF
ncbi:hypothetical protein CANINC_003254 [Pichia inconspicua]|uniref:polynucleotide adenylyltransferase n=1 Tax=Pichia inconspicua TaxID=52247 RepID=A0A4T0WZH3_9ASCO|nr:hypothetical protein CANINC_003254 [[Candida] inconspicua]